MFTYALPTRPPHGFFPKGYAYFNDGTITGEKDSFCRHGVVAYVKPLTDEMINNLELVPFGDSDRLDRIVKELENHKYITKYRELFDSGKDIKPEVCHIIQKKSPVRLHISEIDQIFLNLMEV